MTRRRAPCPTCGEPTYATSRTRTGLQVRSCSCGAHWKVEPMPLIIVATIDATTTDGAPDFRAGAEEFN